MIMRKNHTATAFLLLLETISVALGAFVGVNIGTDVSKLPSASDVVSILKSHQITHVRLYDANAPLLKALSNTGIEVMVGVTNEEVSEIGRSSGAAAAWVSRNIVAYVPSTNITTIAVGSQVPTSAPKTSPFLVLAMNYIHRALVSCNLNFQVKVSTPLSTDIIPNPFPPSAAVFNPAWKTLVYQILRFVKNTNSSLLLNAYPYYGYAKSGGIFPIDYALFQPLPTVKQIVDSNTLLRYDSMFDAMVDAVYYSMTALNFSGIPVTVTETGWPWSGDTDEPDATLDNAETFNNNLMRRVMNGSGTPSQPDIPINVYLYELFDEDNRPGPRSEKSWGVLFTNGSGIYPLSWSAGNNDANASSGVFCVVKEGADIDSLQDGLNWACGQGGANCAAIQPGQPCYTPNTVRSHASYAYNEYYQRMKKAGGTCDFQGTATITRVNPSYGSCVFSGSTNSSSSRVSPAYMISPASPMMLGGSEAVVISAVPPLVSAVLVLLVLLLESMRLCN